MVPVLSLWLPILLSAGLVFIVSSLIHMLLGYHRTDFVAVPAEDRVREALGPLGIPPGEYIVPHAGTPQAMKDPAYLEKVERGPVLFMTVMENRMPGMGKTLAQWFLYCVVVSVFAAYIAGEALAPGAPFAEVFQFTGAVSFVGYVLALWQQSIWYRRKWSTTLKSTLDGVIYALGTAGIFVWLWPGT